jgi:hypothetical protein
VSRIAARPLAFIDAAVPTVHVHPATGGRLTLDLDFDRDIITFIGRPEHLAELARRMAAALGRAGPRPPSPRG